ncbi:MAG: TonB-dependent receptor [Candidatus Margulisiibacteriota bacterium]
MRKTICLLLLLCFSSVSFASDVPVFFGEQIVVTAARRIQPMSQASSPVKVIRARDIDKTGAKTVAEALKSVAEINVKSTGGLGGISTLRLKSASSSQVLILVDGQKINSTLLGVFDLNDIPVSNIERIEIVEDSLSSIYGADALGGVINIITKSAQEKPVTASVNYGSYGEIGAYIGAGGSFSGLSSQVFYQDIKTDGFRQNSDYQNRGYGLSMNWADFVSLKYNVTNSERGNPGVPASDTDSWSASTPFDRQKDFYGNLSLDLMNRADNSLNKLTLFETTQNQHVHYQDSFTGLFTDDRYFSRIYGSEFQNITRFSGAILTTGAEWKRSMGESSKAGNHSLDNSSVYVNLDSGAGLPLAANFGIRYDNSGVWGRELTPRVGMIVDLSGGNRIRYSFAKAFRAPTINELYWNEPSWGMYGNPDLRPEKSDSFNIAFDKFSGNDSLSAGYYSTGITDMISWTQTSPFVWQTQNISSAKVEGISLGLRKEFLPGASFYTNYNKENVTDISSGKAIPYSPDYKLNAGLELAARGLSINLNSKDVSSVYTDTDNTKQLPAYRVVDLIVSKYILSAELTASLLNIFDEKYFESAGYSTVDWQERGYPMPGRRFEVKVTL